MLKLHIGCGAQYKEGWVNIDINPFPKLDLQYDVRKPLPFADTSVQFIYSEHFIEHLAMQEGLDFFKECYRVLIPGGVMRMAAPDLSRIIDQYVNDSWQEDFKRSGITWVTTRCEMLHVCLIHQGHRYTYSFEELELRLKSCGFKNISRQEYGKSKYTELTNIENAWQSFLISEAEK
jgi:predicted SAM-dependent methyltransferase